MGQPLNGGNDTAAQGGALLQGAFTATGNSLSVVLYGSFNVSLWGTFSATVTLARSFDGGTTWLPCMAGANTVQWTAPFSGVPWSELEHTVLYRLQCVYSSGTVNYRISETSDFVFVGGAAPVPTTSVGDGGGGGGGGGGAVTIADGADVAQGSIADAAWSGSGNGTVVSLLKKAISYLAGSFTIQGTVAATGTVGASQVSTWTMQPGNTANTTPWLVDINGGTAAAQSGFITSTGTAAATIIASPGTGVALFIGSAQFSNTSTAQAVVTLSDTKSTQLIVPANGGSNVTFQPPLPLAANTPLTFTTSAATTTILASAQGHKA